MSFFHIYEAALSIQCTKREIFHHFRQGGKGRIKDKGPKNEILISGAPNSLQPNFLIHVLNCKEGKMIHSPKELRITSSILFSRLGEAQN